MRDTLLFFLVYAATPVMLVAGLAVMYAFIGDHPWFYYLAGGYALMLAALYAVKISVYRRLLRKTVPGRQVDGATHG